MDRTTDASGFVLLSDFIPDIVQEIRYFSTFNFVGERIDGYEEPCALLTIDAARALKAISNEMAVRGYRLKIFDAYRPVMAVKRFVDMGGPFDYFGELSHPDYRGITDEQYENRMMLQRTMVRNGFAPYECEWWHFMLEKEPFPDDYFNFPVATYSVKK